MDRPGDIQVLCRLCLVKDQVNIPIFEEQGDIRQIFIKISCCLPVSITKEDNLPKKICDGCSNKLDLLYEFWNTSINAEKTLLTWLGQAGVKDADKTITAVALQIPKAEVEVKVEQPEEIDGGEVEDEEIDGGEVEDFEENDNYEEEEPPPKRARRSAAVKAQMTLANISDDDEDEDIDNDESTTKIEDESDGSEGEVKDPSSFTAIPGTSVDDQPGPSGLGKDGADAPYNTFTEEAICESIVYPLSLMQDPLDIKEEIPDLIDLTFEENSIQNKTSDDKTEKSVLQKLSRNDKVFKCNLCNKYVKRMDNLQKHIRAMHVENIKKVKCSFCDKLVKNQYRMRWHIKQHHSGNDQIFKCNFCSKSFNLSQKLDRHVKLVHSQNSEHCSFCGKLFKNAAYLQAHVKFKHSEINDSLKCHLCDKPFKNMYALRNHGKMHSEDNLQLECKICNQTLKNKYFLHNHIKLQHLGSN